ncbi:protein ripply2 [Fundulus heteroclitus]|uniref:protein ripply2 n=1 Tax=Fundulus heteroclitus TaxID=8078 RepID=UPI00165A89FF|nr:protein ripply2 [Fundulus heteroclitus]
MENNAANVGLAAVVCAGDGPPRENNLWRPWDKTEGKAAQQTARSVHGEISSVRPKIQQVIHPVKLFWPKSRCFDYLYRDAETLLRNYPVQATICPYQDTSSDEEDEEEEEEEEVGGKEQN